MEVTTLYQIKFFSGEHKAIEKEVNDFLASDIIADVKDIKTKIEDGCLTIIVVYERIRTY